MYRLCRRHVCCSWMLNTFKHQPAIYLCDEIDLYFSVFALDSILLHDTAAASNEVNLVFYDNANYTEKLGRIYKEVYTFDTTTTATSMGRNLKLRQLASQVSSSRSVSLYLKLFGIFASLALLLVVAFSAHNIFSTIRHFEIADKSKSTYSVIYSHPVGIEFFNNTLVNCVFKLS